MSERLTRLPLCAPPPFCRTTRVLKAHASCVVSMSQHGCGWIMCWDWVSRGFGWLRRCAPRAGFLPSPGLVPVGTHPTSPATPPHSLCHGLSLADTLENRLHACVSLIGDVWARSACAVRGRRWLIPLFFQTTFFFSSVGGRQPFDATLSKPAHTPLAAHPTRSHPRPS